MKKEYSIGKTIELHNPFVNFIVNCLLLLIGFLFIYGGYWFYTSQGAFAKNALQATGKIIDVEVQSKLRDGKRETFYNPRIIFKTSSGTEIEGLPLNRTKDSLIYTAGNEQIIYYNPDKPTQFQTTLPSTSGGLLFYALFGLMGVVIVLVAIKRIIFSFI